MRNAAILSSRAFAAALAVGTLPKNASAAVVIDGTLDADYGSILSTQTLTSNAQTNGADSTPVSSHVQLSNAYGQVDVANNHLNLFLGGAMNLNNERLILLIDADPTTGVANLNLGAHSGVNDVGNVPTFAQSNNLKGAVMDAGFRPESMVQVMFGGGEQLYFDNLANGTETPYAFAADPRGHTVTPIHRGAGAVNGAVTDSASAPALTISDNTGNEGTLISSGFDAITTGYEIQFNLSDLGYAVGSPINVSADHHPAEQPGDVEPVAGPDRFELHARQQLLQFQFREQHALAGQSILHRPRPGARAGDTRADRHWQPVAAGPTPREVIAAYRARFKSRRVRVNTPVLYLVIESGFQFDRPRSARHK